MTNEFILVRHGTCQHTDDMLLGRTVDAPLDARGMQQAAAVASVLRIREPLLVLTSPRLRTQQTGEAIALASDCELIGSHAIDELDFGSWSGRTFAELAGDPSWQAWNEHRGSAATPSGERMADVQARAIAHLHRLRLAFPARTLIIVTHAEVIRALLLHWLEAPVDGYHRLAIDPASYSTVRMGDWGVRIEGINQRVSL